MSMLSTLCIMGKLDYITDQANGNGSLSSRTNAGDVVADPRDQFFSF